MGGLPGTAERYVLRVVVVMGFAREIGDRVMMFDRGGRSRKGRCARCFSQPPEARTRSFLDAVLDHE